MYYNDSLHFLKLLWFTDKKNLNSVFGKMNPDELVNPNHLSMGQWLHILTVSQKMFTETTRRPQNQGFTIKYIHRKLSGRNFEKGLPANRQAQP